MPSPDQLPTILSNLESYGNRIPVIATFEDFGYIAAAAQVVSKRNLKGLNMSVGIINTYETGYLGPDNNPELLPEGYIKIDPVGEFPDDSSKATFIAATMGAAKKIHYKHFEQSFSNNPSFTPDVQYAVDAAIIARVAFESHYLEFFRHLGN